MRVYVRNLLLVGLAELLVCSPAFAQMGVYLPPAPQGPGGEDTIESASGTRCRQSINSNSGYVDVGVAGTAGSGIPQGHGVFVSVTDRDTEAMAYARVTIPLGKRPQRLDCSKVYELEIERLKQEIELLKLNVE